MEHCITPTCDREATRRGLCNACYMATRRMIAKKTTTDAALVRRGLIRKPHSTPPATESPIRRAMRTKPN